jgi:drug/metabolite transporter (DMT)-like permease
MLLPIFALGEGASGFSGLSTNGCLGLLGIGCFSTGLARCGYVWVISKAGSVAGSLLTYIVPVAALAMSWVFLGEVPTEAKILGALLVGVAITCTLLGTSAVARSRSPASSKPSMNPAVSTT